MRLLKGFSRLALLIALTSGFLACIAQDPDASGLHRWWSGLGPVLPHETFPADCKLCHTGENWNTLRPDFRFDHLKETGVPLIGAHAQARCLRCHNDRGPVEVFVRQGCQGCHQDVHLSELGPNCTLCHVQETWVPVGQIELHNRTRFPLVGVHAVTPCRRCHPAVEVGRFQPVAIECVSCHRDDLLRTANHVGLGWVDRCDRCHMPTSWLEAQID